MSSACCSSCGASCAATAASCAACGAAFAGVLAATAAERDTGNETAADRRRRLVLTLVGMAIVIGSLVLALAFRGH